jgi:ABC-type glutathione transport system ATPase component
VKSPLLEIRKASRTFRTGVSPFSRDAFTAVDDVSFRLENGRTLGIVGESGSGKSTLLRMILHLIRPTSGEILFEGRDIWTLSGRELLGVRRQMHAIFQDPASSFDPRQSIGAILAAPLEVHRIGTAAKRAKTVADTLELVGLSSTYASRRPHQLSGGQRQRVDVARAIILRPSLIVADEPTSALDVSLQAQILALLQKINRELGLACVFVSHNLGVIRVIADDVAVMRRGKIVEAGPVEQVFETPSEKYTRALIDAVPRPFPPKIARFVLPIRCRGIASCSK